MEFALLIHGDEVVWDNFSQAESDEIIAAHGRFGQDLAAAGVKVLYGGGLDRAATARLVLREGTVVAGPHSSGREQLGGLWVIDVPSLEDATAWAARMPFAPGDLVEVRPVTST